MVDGGIFFYDLCHLCLKVTKVCFGGLDHLRNGLVRAGFIGGQSRIIGLPIFEMGIALVVLSVSFQIFQITVQILIGRNQGGGFPSGNFSFGWC